MNENKANYAKIGFFILAGAALILLAIGIAGARTWRRKTVLAETYFSESVTGLDIGSAVKYRGVPIGEVKEIGFVFTTYEMNSDPVAGSGPQSRQILVVMELDPGRFPLLKRFDPRKVFSELIKYGLRAKLSSSGVTGLAYIELDYFAAGSSSTADPSAQLPWRAKRIYVPSVSSTFTVLRNAMDDVIVKVSSINIKALGDQLLATLYLFQDKLEKIDVEGVSGETAALLKEARQTNRQLRELIASPAAQSLPGSLAETLASVRRSAEKIEKQIDPLAGELSDVAGKAGALLDATGGIVASNRVQIGQAVTLLGGAAQSLNRAAQSQEGNLSETLAKLKEASESLARLLKELGGNPASLLYGQPPAPLPETRPAKK